jgi:SAM-dependent methyltransferase
MNCKICNSDNVRQLDKQVQEAQDAIVYHCYNCEHTFLDNINFSGNFYKKEFDSFMAERAKDSSWLNPHSHHQKRLEEAKSRINLLNKYIDFAKIDSLLELGTSSGFFLSVLQEVYPQIQAFGVEPSNRHRKHACDLGFDVRNKIDDFNNHTFDVIIAFFVLEHVPSPKQWLAHLKKFTKPGTIIIMVVPHGREALVSIYHDANYDKFVWQAPHISYFSQKSLRILLEKISENIHVYQYQRYSLANHLNWMSGLKPEKSLDYEHITEEINILYKQSLEAHEIADTLIGMAYVR